MARQSLRALALVCAVGVLGTTVTPGTAQPQQAPINCFTAGGDIRVLPSEKANVAQQMAAGLAAIVPTSIVVGLLTGTEGTKAQVESGEYNRKIDEIKSTCGVQ